MSRSVVFGAALLLLLSGAAGCRRSPEQLGEDQLAAIREVTGILEGIHDDASAQAALPRLEKAAARLGTINEQASKAKPLGEKEAVQKLNDPQTQQKIQELMQVSVQMMQAQMQAELKAPGRRAQIEAAMKKANMSQ